MESPRQPAAGRVTSLSVRAPRNMEGSNNWCNRFEDVLWEVNSGQEMPEDKPEEEVVEEEDIQPSPWTHQKEFDMRSRRMGWLLMRDSVLRPRPPARRSPGPPSVPMPPHLVEKLEEMVARQLRRQDEEAAKPRIPSPAPPSPAHSTATVKRRRPYLPEEADPSRLNYVEMDVLLDEMIARRLRRLDEEAAKTRIPSPAPSSPRSTPTAKRRRLYLPGEAGPSRLEFVEVDVVFAEELPSSEPRHPEDEPAEEVPGFPRTPSPTTSEEQGLTTTTSGPFQVEVMFEEIIPSAPWAPPVEEI